MRVLQDAKQLFRFRMLDSYPRRPLYLYVLQNEVEGLLEYFTLNIKV